jgi:hypothetical protein
MVLNTIVASGNKSVIVANSHSSSTATTASSCSGCADLSKNGFECRCLGNVGVHLSVSITRCFFLNCCSFDPV